MELKATVLFETPQYEIAHLINKKISKAKSIKIVTGFVTVEGVKALQSALITNSHAVETFIIGTGTYKAYEAFDKLIDHGISQDKLFVHLGHTRFTKDGASHAFYRYHPMLHSKIYYMENEDGSACAFIGSHNITGFALMGLNGEASVMLEGDVHHAEFEKIRRHISQAKNEAVMYNSEMKEAFAWWTNEFMEGLVQKSKDIAKDGDNKKTILIFCDYKNELPKRNEILYFELLQAIGTIQSMRAEVHLFIFDKLSATPQQCLENLQSAKVSFWCKTEGIENNKGGRELSTDWYIDGNTTPTIKKASKPFRPNPTLDKQQIRVKLLNTVYEKNNYLFEKQSNEWLPILNDKKTITYSQSFSTEIIKLELIPPENNAWSLVVGLEPKEKGFNDKPAYQLALKAMAPESGGFILFSTGRRKHYKD